MQRNGVVSQFCTARGTGDTGTIIHREEGECTWQAGKQESRRAVTLSAQHCQSRDLVPDALPRPLVITSLVSANYCFGCQAFLKHFCLLPALCWAHWAGISAVTVTRLRVKSSFPLSVNEPQLCPSWGTAEISSPKAEGAMGALVLPRSLSRR